MLKSHCSVFRLNTAFLGMSKFFRFLYVHSYGIQLTQDETSKLQFFYFFCLVKYFVVVWLFILLFIYALFIPRGKIKDLIETVLVFPRPFHLYTEPNQNCADIEHFHMPPKWGFKHCYERLHCYESYYNLIHIILLAHRGSLNFIWASSWENLSSVFLTHIGLLSYRDKLESWNFWI